MKKILTAVALATALPAAAHAADAPASGGKMACCEKMKAESRGCCCMGMSGSHDQLADQHGKQAPSEQPKPDQHQNHQQ
jgi:opacity protein-like surface antigen